MSDDLGGGRWRRVFACDWLQRAVQSLNNDERLVWLYCLTGPQSTSVGIYRISTAVAVEELGNVTAEDFEARLVVVCEAFGWHYDPVVRVLWIPEWLEKNPPQSPNVVVNWRKLAYNVPDCALKVAAVDAIHDYLKGKKDEFRKAFGSYRPSLPEGFPQAKALPKAKAVANQRAGIKDPRSERKEHALRGRLRRGKSTTETHAIDIRLLNIVREVTREFPNQTHETRVDHVLDVCLHRHVATTRAAVLAALDQSLEGMTA